MKFKNALTESSDSMENLIRDHLSGTNRAVTPNMMWQAVAQTIKGANKRIFVQVWKGLIKDGFLVPAANGTYQWEM